MNNNNESEQEHPVLKNLSKIAFDELHEDPKKREQTIQLMREWLKQNNDVVNVRDDASFLLRFLRTKKFSIAMAQQQLLKYLNLRRVLSNYVTRLDYLSPNIKNIIDSGYMFASPVRDSMGRRVIISMAKNFDFDRFSSEDFARVHSLTYETLMEDEIEQILGVVHVGDFESVGPRHVTLFNLTDFIKIIRWGEQSLPMRHKAIHIFNVHPAVKFVVDHAKAMVSEKIRNRLHVYVNLEKFQEAIDVNTLPAELGGTIPMTTMIELWKQELAAKRDKLVALDDMKILSTDGIISSKNKNGQSIKNRALAENGISMMGSFRKLEID